MVKWRVRTVKADELETTLNSLAQEYFKVYSVLPTDNGKSYVVVGMHVPQRKKRYDDGDRNDSEY